MQGKGCVGVISVIVTMTAMTTSPAWAYLEPASVILETVAERRHALAFRSVTLDGYDPLSTDGGPTMTPVWMAIRSGQGQRTEYRDPAGTRIELLSARRDLYRFARGVAPSTPPERVRAAPLLELLGDARADPGGRRGLALLARMGIDAEVVTLDRFNGRPVYIIGAGPGDLGPPQLWIDKEAYVPVRWLMPNRSLGGIDDVRLSGFQYPTTGPWWPERMEVWRGDKRARALVFTRARMNTPVDAALFEPPVAGAR